ncbi:M10 family metallopeptidase C-terminal domain-containing protein [Qipengyuania zhejiangensis]|uniref:M10 family metallopeptidase C-terminal domain-containing protein n=1 Tax=Qipengyuania zhejiangensis TaxID=3077782 RepID=UPI002D7A0F4A|nr:M10 family metallopeptidase C-terminal domain-containing protein [Qipengyuania sp. Z2]
MFTENLGRGEWGLRQWALAGDTTQTASPAATFEIAAEKIVRSYIDIPGDSSTTAVVTIDSTTVNVLETEGDTDWFRIDLSIGQRISIALNGAGASPLSDPLLQLRDAAGNVVAANDDFGSLNSFLTYITTLDGTYYIDAGAFADSYAGEYELIVSLADVADDNSTDISINIGNSQVGYLDVVGDHDRYAIQLVEGETVQINLSGIGNVDLNDPYLRIYDAAGNLVASNDDSGTLDSEVVFQALSSGTYYIDAGAFADGYTGSYIIETQYTDPPPPLTEFTYDEIALQLLEGYWGGNTFSFDVGADGSITVNLTAIEADAQNLARAALDLWSDITGINFVEVSVAAEITFQETDSGAYAEFTSATGTGPNTVQINSALVNISTSWLDTYGVTFDTYSFQTYIHEIGHALGLGHGGDYNGSANYPTDALYLNDAWATTVMSYFDQEENTFFGIQGFSWALVTTPMAGDIVAITSHYGASTTTRTGNTTYGFNSNSDRAIHDATQFADTAYAIYDSAGLDMLDYSGFAADQLINLNPETFMNIGGLVGNVVIGRGVDIENARGGSGNDTIIGNDLANDLNGLDGNDRLEGGGGDDRLVGSNGDDTLFGGGGQDTLLGGSGADTMHGEGLADTMNGGSGNDYMTGSFGADVIFGGDGIDQIFGDSNNDYLRGGNDADTIRGGQGADNLGGGEGDDYLYGEDGNDRIQGNGGIDRIYGGNGDDLLRGGDDADRIYGGDGADTLRGDNGADLLVGGIGDDLIKGGAGNDSIWGDDGNDRLVGESGSDDFYFSSALSATNVDAIVDFEVGIDTIQLDRGIFAQISVVGTLNAGAFRTGTDALDADDRIIYRKSTGEIFYDADGSGSGAKVLFATVAAGTLLSAADFEAFGNPVPAEPIGGLPKGFDPDILGADMLLIA